MKAFATASILLSLGLGHVSSANGQVVPPVVPTMTIKIFNDDPAHYIFLFLRLVRARWISGCKRSLKSHR
jgi:hypothetical protein